MPATSPSIPGGRVGTGQPGADEDGAEARAGAAGTAGGSPGEQAGGRADTAPGAGDPEAALEKSLGDFDGEIAREREGMAATGKGTTRSAQGREAGDAGAIKTASGRGPGRGLDSGGEDGMGAGGPVAGAASESDEAAAGSGEQAGAGSAEERDGGEGGAAANTPRQGAAVADIPEDIPADGSGEDQVARQLREAAMAEKDPAVREALWDEYRRHTGIRK